MVLVQCSEDEENALWLNTIKANCYRPWFALYGKFLGRKKEDEEEELAPVQQLPDELQTLVLERLPAYSLGVMACVCKSFKDLVEQPRLWERACSEVLSISYPDRASLSKQAVEQYKGCWKQMFIHHPHMRFDGLYVSRNTYIRTGVTEWAVRRSCSPVHVVVYYRYYRFFPDGTLLYCTSPATVASVAKAMSGPCTHLQQQQQQQQKSVFWGRWTIKGCKVWAVVRYPNSWSTEIRSRFTLRSTHVGANNRLDIESIQSYDRELRMGSSMLPAQQLEEQHGIAPSGSASSPHPEAAPAEGEAVCKQHLRGTSSAVFVTWEQVSTSVLNLPLSQMDMFIPG